MRTYSLIPISWLLRDESDDERLKRLRFHIEQGDYFPFLASVIGFLEEAARACTGDPDNKTKADFAASVRKDLIHLHEHYQLKESKAPRTYSTRKMVRF
ncbi:MAG TPA: hypothetical protein VGE53_00520 [Candidatus Paceibacterota bacterium]